jgi:hypothetical protein
MFRCQYCAILRELTVSHQICYTNVMDAKTEDSESRCTFTILGFSIHDVSVTDFIRNCELPEDGTGLAPKHVGEIGTAHF